MVSVKPLTNASDLSKICFCDPDPSIVLTENVTPLLLAYTPSLGRAGRRKAK